MTGPPSRQSWLRLLSSGVLCDVHADNGKIVAVFDPVAFLDAADVSDLVKQSLGCQSVVNLCAAQKCNSVELRSHFSRLFPLIPQPSDDEECRMKFKIACALRQRESEYIYSGLLRALSHNTYLVARSRDSKGGKIDGQFKLYRCFVLDVKERGIFRDAGVVLYSKEYGEEASVSGNPQHEYTFNLGRVFIELSEKDNNAVFYPAGYISSYMMQSDEDKVLARKLLPLFGHVYNDKVFPQSMIPVSFNPSFTL